MALLLITPTYQDVSLLYPTETTLNRQTASRIRKFACALNLHDCLIPLTRLPESLQKFCSKLGGSYPPQLAASQAYGLSVQ